MTAQAAPNTAESQLEREFIDKFRAPNYTPHTVVHQNRIKTVYSHHRYDALQLINAMRALNMSSRRPQPGGSA